MSLGFYYTSIAVLLVFFVACVAGWRFRQHYATNWHRRAKLAKFSLVYFIIILAVMCILNFANDKPFWPWEAISLGCWLVVLSSLVYSWREARRRAAAEPLPPAAPSKPPTFLWQAVLILLPVVIMTVVGLVALIRDRAAVENEARQRAEELIERLQANFGRRGGGALTGVGVFSYQWKQHQMRSRGSWPDSSERYEWNRVSTNVYSKMVADWERKFPGLPPEAVLPNSITFDTQGRLQWPTPAQNPPQPSDWYRALTPEQLGTWLSVRAAENDADQGTLSNRIAAFLALLPSEAAQANARFIQLRQECQQFDPKSAFARFREFKWGHQHIQTESGLPLYSLAFAEMLRCAEVLGPDEIFWKELGWHVESYPSPLIPVLLDRAEALICTNKVLRDSVAAWRWVWQGDERAREIAAAIIAAQPLSENVT